MPQKGEGLTPETPPRLLDMITTHSFLCNLRMGQMLICKLGENDVLNEDKILKISKYK